MYSQKNVNWIWSDGDSQLKEDSYYGVKGKSDPNNMPSKRSGSVSFTDLDGNLWLFGGDGFFNDLWKYSINENEWTWISGSDSGNQSSVYGIQGVPSKSNIPGGRKYHVSWTDLNGDFWLFGGWGEDGYVNDFWKFDHSEGQWIWFGGGKSTDSEGNPSSFGERGISNSSNLPGSRRHSTSWTDSKGNLWLFGGNGVDAKGELGYLNELWKYDVDSSMWTWVSGGRDISTESLLPIPRSSSTGWIDSDDNLWLFGGRNNLGRFNHLWKFNINESIWTKIRGSENYNLPPVYGPKGTSSISNDPGGRTNSIGWIDLDDNLWLFGGESRNDLWKFNALSLQWSWMGGSQETGELGIYNERGISSSENIPSSRTFSIGWKDLEGNFWLFGGLGVSRTYGNSKEDVSLNDLWKFELNSNEWTWIDGKNSVSNSGMYGKKGNISPTNSPGGRVYSSSWTDLDGNFWMFGGEGYDKNGVSGTEHSSSNLNDLWQYNVVENSWIWISGSDVTNPEGNYGIKGIGLNSNVPNPRKKSLSWTDNNGELWLFGGNGIGLLNDLWKYSINTNEWTWISGDSISRQTGKYGTKGISSPDNIPGSREGSVGWKDLDDNLWLYGGRASTVNLFNDLWKCSINTNEWTWISGDSIPNQTGKYGTKGISSPDNIPGSREVSVGWTDLDGNFWMFGGRGYDSFGFESNRDGNTLNDLWKYEVSTGEWTWISGSNVISQSSIYGDKGIPSTINIPSSREEHISWTDPNGFIWIFGGWGFDDTFKLNRLNDLWRYDANTNMWTWYGGGGIDPRGSYNLISISYYSNIPHGRVGSVGWVDTDGKLFLFGGSDRYEYFNDLMIAIPCSGNEDVPGSGEDGNCDGMFTWFEDRDNDGFGSTVQIASKNSSPGLGESELDNDCDDTDELINPNTVWYKDSDQDGFGDINITEISCNQILNYVLNGEDCDDSDGTLNPNTIWYYDGDGDGFGDSNNSMISCEKPDEYVIDDSDCDDLDGELTPLNSCIITDIQDDFNKIVNIYPNPSNGRIYITGLNGDILEIRLYNVQGSRLNFHYQLNSIQDDKSFQIKLNSGLYFFLIKTKKELIWKKVIVY